jgi:PAS domain S-box-containing protein
MSENLKKKIEKLEEKHRLIADNLLDAIFVLDAATLKFDYVTPSIEKLSGYSPDEYKKFTIMDRLTSESYKKVEVILAEELKKCDQGSHVIRTLEVELIHKNGDTYWSEIRARFIEEADKPLKIIGTLRDISERKKSEKEQTGLMQKLAEALAEKERLLKEIKVLEGLLPICSGCRRVKDEQGKWWPLDAYVNAQTEAELTHTICSDCQDVFYSDL